MTKSFIFKKFLTFSSTLLFISCSQLSTPQKKTNSSDLHIQKEYLKTIDFKDKEVASIKIKNKFFYVRKDGKMIETVEYDGKADEFSDGLARTKVNGKIGFFNRNLEIVLKPLYDFAFPFHNGFAEICMGCKEDTDNSLDGGSWKKINREGLVIE